jgi:hypothetical protein
MRPDEQPNAKRLKQFARWTLARSKNLLIAAPSGIHRLCVCSCGNVKPMSANFCHECKEARKIIVGKTDSPSYTNKKLEDQRLPVIVQRQCKMPLDARTNKEPVAFEQNNSFDDIVKLYEDCQ